MNLLPAEVRDGVLRVAGVDVPLARPLGAAGPVTLGVRPAALRIAEHGLPARVYLIENLGDTTIVDLDIGGQVVKLRTEQASPLREGDAVHVSFAPEAMHVFERESGARRDA
jgi:ABC-type sugar transport system ATPase subunit